MKKRLILALAGLVAVALHAAPTHAVLLDGANAENLIGQYTSTDTSATSPIYTTSSANNGPASIIGLNSPNGIAHDSTNKRLFIADSTNNRVLVFNLDTNNVLADRIPDYVLGQPDFRSNTAATTQAGMNNPQGLAYDATNNRLFVAQQTSRRVIVYDVASITNGENAVNVLGQANFTSSTAATTQAGMMSPRVLAYDATNNRLFVGDFAASRVTVYDVASITDGENAVNVLGQPNFNNNAPATTQAGMINVQGLAYDATNNRLFVAQGNSAHRVTVYDVASITDGENAVNVLGQANFTNGTAANTQAGMSTTQGLAYDSGNSRLYVAQSGSHRVTVYDVASITDGENAISVLGQTDYTTATPGFSQANFSGPQGLAFDSVNNVLYVSQSGSSRVSVFDVASITNGENATNLIGQYTDTDTSATSPLYTVGTANNGPANRIGLSSPNGIALDIVNKRLFVADTSNNRVLVYNLAADNTLADRIPDFVLGQTNFRNNSAATTQAGMSAPQAIAYDSINNRLFVSESGNNRVTVFDVASITNGENAVNVLGQANFISSGATTSQNRMNSPRGLIYDATNSRLFVSQLNSHRVTTYDVASITDGENAINVLGQANFTSATTATTQAGMNGPLGLAFDSKTSRLFVAEQNNRRVIVYDVASITDGENAINVLGQANFTSNASATTQAGMIWPIGLAFDSINDRLFVSQQSTNNRITVYNVASIADGENAVNVLGQADFTSGSAATSQSGISAPASLCYDPSTQKLFVSDSSNNRITIYEASALGNRMMH